MDGAWAGEPKRKRERGNTQVSLTGMSVVSHPEIEVILSRLLNRRPPRRQIEIIPVLSLHVYNERQGAGQGKDRQARRRPLPHSRATLQQPREKNHGRKRNR